MIGFNAHSGPSRVRVDAISSCTHVVSAFDSSQWTNRVSLTGAQAVGWVERSDTHHFGCMLPMGFAALNPSYDSLTGTQISSLPLPVAGSNVSPERSTVC